MLFLRAKASRIFARIGSLPPINIPEKMQGGPTVSVDFAGQIR